MVPVAIMSGLMRPSRVGPMDEKNARLSKRSAGSTINIIKLIAASIDACMLSAGLAVNFHLSARSTYSPAEAMCGFMRHI